MDSMTQEEFEKLIPGDVVQLKDNQRAKWLDNAIVEIVRPGRPGQHYTKVVYLNVDPLESDWALIVPENTDLDSDFKPRHFGKLWSTLKRNALRPKCQHLNKKYGYEKS